MNVMPQPPEVKNFTDKTDLFPSFDKLANKMAWFLGSNASILTHTFIFEFFLILVILGYNLDSVMLILTTIVSLEAIYLSIFIQRTTNKQSEKLERFVREIRYNTVTHLEEPMDKVVNDLRELAEDTHQLVEKTHELIRAHKSLAPKTNGHKIEPKVKVS